MHSKYDNIHKNRILYALIFINNHIIMCIKCILSIVVLIDKPFAKGFLDQYKLTMRESVMHIPITLCKVYV